MKKLLSVILTLFMLCINFSYMPAMIAETEVIPAATRARTTLLDLSSATSSSSNTSEGWAFNPTGSGGYPKLTLNSYGLESQHSAPILLPPNTTIVVNGTCYIDNSYMNQKYNDITVLCNGYLHIEGTGTLNLYANQYQGRCISKESGSESNHNDDLVIENVTINCYNTERDMHTAFSNEACIWAYKSMTIRNAVVNTYYGRWGLRIWGETPIGGVSEETADEILIENSIVNIQNESENGIWQYAIGIENTFGRIRITGNSNVTINAGSNSIYAYLSLVIEGGVVDVRSTPVSTTETYALVCCNKLVVGSEVERVYFTTKKYPLSTVLYCKEPGSSTLGDGLQVNIGSYGSNGFETATDPSTGMPALEIVPEGSTPSLLLGDVNCDGIVDFADVTDLYAFLMNVRILTPDGLNNADVNGNGSVTMDDVSALYIMLLNR